jgi:hypothetical protein
VTAIVPDVAILAAPVVAEETTKDAVVEVLVPIRNFFRADSTSTTSERPVTLYANCEPVTSISFAGSAVVSKLVPWLVAELADTVTSVVPISAV